MIDGINVVLTTMQLVPMLNERITHHAGRITEWEEALNNMATDPFPSPTNDDPRKIAQDRIDFHTRRKLFFQFLVSNTPLNETFRLNEAELVRLELAAKFV